MFQIQRGEKNLGSNDKERREKNKYSINQTVKYPTLDVPEELKQKIETDTQKGDLACSVSNETLHAKDKLAGTHKRFASLKQLARKRTKEGRVEHMEFNILL